METKRIQLATAEDINKLNEDLNSFTEKIEDVDDSLSLINKSVEGINDLVGATSIESIGDGTITGAIAYLNENGGSGGGGFKLAAPTNINITNKDEACIITWADPDDFVIEGATQATWAGTTVVRKEGTAPTGKADGVVVVDSKVRNQYADNGFEDTDLNNGVTYYYGIFPYSTDKVYTTTSVTGFIPEEILPSAATDLAVTTNKDNMSATVTFTMPSDATSAKVVMKQGSAPSSITDGTAKTASGNEATFTGLELDETYYFKVFTYNTKGREKMSDTSISATIKSLSICTWADGTDEEIAAMLEAHYNNDLDIRDYWAVGDVRNINLAAMGASSITNSRNVAETHSAQVVQLVILDFEHDTLTTPINSHTKAAITVQTKDCLKVESNPNYQSENSKFDAGMGSMNNYSGTHTNSGGWKSSARRAWCNGQFKNSLPSTVKNIIKQVKIYTDNTGGGSDTASYVTATDDYAFFPAEWEIFGARTYANSAEKNHQSQYEYFKTTANRCKNPKWNSSSASGRWWERSPYSGYSASFCYVSGSGNTGSGDAGYACGLAPAFCL